MEKYLYQDLYILEESHWWHSSKRNAVVNLIKTNFKHPQNLKILDIGCGTGKNLESLKIFGKTYGIDNSKDAILFCKKRHLSNIYRRDSKNTKFPSNFFDIVLLLDVLEHVNEKPTLTEIHRVLKQNGILIITVPAYKWLWSQWDVVLHHKRRYDRTQLKKVLLDNNLKLQRSFYMYSFLILPVIFIRFIKSKINKSSNYTSDFQLNSPIINTALLYLSKMEAHLNNKFPIPFGTSLMALSTKND